MKTDVIADGRTRQPMTTLVACAALCLVLVAAVVLQSPGVSTGLRWRFGPRSRTLELVEIEPVEFVFTFDLQSGDDWFTRLLWALAGLLVAAIMFVLARALRRSRMRSPATHIARTGADSRTPDNPDARILHSGLVAAIEVLATERDPGNAVVRAWQGLEDAAASAGVTRRPAETTTEFTARILYRSRGSAASIGVLLSLYQRVRFGEHTPDAGDIADAQESLTRLVELWRADFPGQRPMRVMR